MWVQLLKGKRIDVRGEMRSYHAGDWIDVGKHLALAWIADKEAFVPEYKAEDFAVEGSGVVVRGDMAVATTKLEPIRKCLAGIWFSEPWLNYKRTLLWHTTATLRTELINVGFRLLDVWQLAVPLIDYRVLARAIGTEEEREKTKAVVHDLRVPVYDTRLIFARDCPETRDLFGRWQRDMGQGGEEALAFLRSLYQVKPLICALPVTWVNREYIP